MKKYSTILIAVLTVLLLCACDGDGTENKTTPMPTAEVQTTAQPMPTLTFTPAENNTLNGFKVEFVGAELTQDQDFSDALRVYIQATNVSDKAMSLHYALQPRAMQGGAELERSAPVSVLRYDGVGDLILRPGTSVRCTEVITLNNLSEPVTISYFDLNEIDSSVNIAYTFDLQNLPDKLEPFFVDLVTDPQWAADMYPEGMIGGFELAILDCEVVELMEGNDGIRVYYSFKNNTENAVMFTTELNAVVYQDDVALKADYPLEDDEKDLYADVEVLPGDTLVFAKIYELTSDSPVVVEISGIGYDERVGGIYPLAVEE